MITTQSVRYLFLYGILCWVMGPVLDLCGVVGENKYTVLLAVSALLFSIVLSIITFVRWIVSDKSDIEDIYLCICGREHYHWIFTVSMISAVLYAFVYDYVAYCTIRTIAFFIVDRW